jgi:hypothetical protein
MEVDNAVESFAVHATWVQCAAGALRAVATISCSVFVLFALGTYVALGSIGSIAAWSSGYPQAMLETLVATLAIAVAAVSLGGVRRVSVSPTLVRLEPFVGRTVTLDRARSSFLVRKARILGVGSLRFAEANQRPQSRFLTLGQASALTQSGLPSVRSMGHMQ